MARSLPSRRQGGLRRSLTKPSERAHPPPATAPAPGLLLPPSHVSLLPLPSQVRRLEKQLAKTRKELSVGEDRCSALARRLAALAVSGTESHATDVGYWVERSKRDDFAQV